MNVIFKNDLPRFERDENLYFKISNALTFYVYVLFIDFTLTFRRRIIRIFFCFSTFFENVRLFVMLAVENCPVFKYMMPDKIFFCD